VEKRRLKKKDAIALAVGRVIDKSKKKNISCLKLVMDIVIIPLMRRVSIWKGAWMGYISSELPLGQMS
jgi:hypothetical protein